MNEKRDSSFLFEFRFWEVKRETGRLSAYSNPDQRITNEKRG